MTVVYVLGIFIWLCMVTAWLLARRRAARAETALESAQSEKSEAELAAVAAGDRARLHERRAGEFFGIIRGIELERDQWQKWFHESTRQAGVAQSWLYRDLEAAVARANGLAAELRKLGKAVKDVAIDPKLQGVMAEIGETARVAVPRAPGMKEAEALEASLRGKTDPGPPV